MLLIIKKYGGSVKVHVEKTCPWGGWLNSGKDEAPVMLQDTEQFSPRAGVSKGTVKVQKT